MWIWHSGCVCVCVCVYMLSRVQLFVNVDLVLWRVCVGCVCVCVRAQSCTTLCNPMDCSPARLLCPWDSTGENTGVGSHALLHRIFPTHGLNPCLLHCRLILYSLSRKGSPLALWRGV